MRPLAEKSLARLLLLLVLLVNGWGLLPELTISRVDLNDNALHYALTQGVVQAIERHANPIDWWANDWSLGYPVLRTYQPLGHLLVALIYFAFGKSVSLMTVFVWVRYLSVALLPLSFFAAARLLGLPPITASAAAMLSPLISTSALYGLEYGSYLWAGSGLFTQAIASHFLLLSIGFGFRAIKRGQFVALTGCLVGLTFLAHFIYGYMAGVSLLLLTLLPDREISPLRRLVRFSYVGVTALVLASFELVPLFKDGAIINRSRWEYSWKWDSFGAPQVLKSLFTGQILDHGRLPVLSLLALVGLILCARQLWLSRYKPQTGSLAIHTFVAAGALTWILLLFGRPFWGPALTLVLATDTLQLHRVIGGAQVFLILLAAVALSAMWSALARRRYTPVAVLATLALFYPMVAERAQYLANDAKWGKANLETAAANRPFVQVALNDASTRGGRAYAGLAAGWGASFKIGELPFYAYLSEARVPTLGFLFHSMALTSDIMARFDEQNPFHYRLFNVNTVIAPRQQAAGLPRFITPIEQAGPLVILKAPGSGYFDVVDALYSVRVTRDSFYDVADRWLHSDWLAKGQHLVLDLNGTMPTPTGRLSPDDPLPSPPAMPLAGVVQAERQRNDTYEADIVTTRPSYVLFKMTWHPDWAAYVNGVRQPTRMLTPGFVGVPVGIGAFHLLLRYEPEKWKAFLIILGPLLAGLLWIGERKGYLVKLENTLSEQLSHPLISPAWRHRWLIAGGLLILSLPVWIVLITPRLPEGHDALEYLPRLVEFHQNIAHGIFVPRWAPDFGDGAGQPLFLYNPPLIYYLSEAWHLLGFDFVRSLNLACLVLILGSAFAMFLLGRLYGGDPGGWIAAAAYIYAPYFCVDLYVRSALAEFAAFPFFALTLYGFGAFAKYRKSTQLALGAAGYAGVLLSHNPAALLFTPLVLAFLAFSAWQAKSLRILWSQLAGLALGLGLAAFVWLPALLERPSVQLELLRQGYLRYSNHFVYLHQLWDSPWGYGLSVAGDADGMSFSLGWSHLLLAAIVVAIFTTRKQLRASRSLVVFFAATTVVLAWFMLIQSQWIWDRLPLLQFVEFPWRLLGPVTVCLALLMAPLGSLLWSGRYKVWYVAAIALLVLPNLGHLHPGQFGAVDVEFWTAPQIARRHIGAATADEYRPRWLQPAALASIQNSEVLRQARNTPESWAGEVDLAQESAIEIPIAYFPGWQVHLDNTTVPVEPSPSGLLKVRVPPGKHRITAAWAGNIPSRTGDGVSLLAVALLLLLVAPRGRGWLARLRYRVDREATLLSRTAETAG